MKNLFNKLFMSASTLFKPLVIYLVVIVTSVASFFIGKFYYKLKSSPETVVSKNVIGKADIVLAINERNELMLINPKSGDYTVYSDSVGVAIFSLYTKNLWGQHTPSN